MVESTSDRVTMTLKKNTKERLRRLGEKDQSYDYVISKLLDISAKAYEEERNKKNRNVPK